MKSSGIKKINQSWKLSTSLNLEGYRKGGGGGTRHLTTKKQQPFFLQMWFKGQLQLFSTWALFSYNVWFEFSFCLSGALLSIFQNRDRYQRQAYWKGFSFFLFFRYVHMITVIVSCCLTGQIMAPPLSTAGGLTRTKKIKNRKKGTRFPNMEKQLPESDWLWLIDLKNIYNQKQSHH